jgi:hypothetical protein
MQNAITWFEIPAVEFDRAVSFYSAIFNTDFHKGEFMGDPHGFFPADASAVGGAIVKREDLTPSTTGMLIYLNAGNDLNTIVARVAAAGGQVLTPVTSIDPQGHMAIILDTEGNRVGLHQPPQAES